MLVAVDLEAEVVFPNILPKVLTGHWPVMFDPIFGLNIMLHDICNANRVGISTCCIVKTLVWSVGLCIRVSIF